MSCSAAIATAAMKTTGCETAGMTTSLVTGATRGVGREVARRLVEAGHNVYLGARDAARGRSVTVVVPERPPKSSVSRSVMRHVSWM